MMKKLAFFGDPVSLFVSFSWSTKPYWPPTVSSRSSDFSPMLLAADDDIIACDLAEEVSELPLGVSLGAADGLLDPVIDQEAVSLAEVVDLEALVLYRLLVAADSDVSVCHILV